MVKNGQHRREDADYTVVSDRRRFAWRSPDHVTSATCRHAGQTPWNRFIGFRLATLLLVASTIVLVPPAHAGAAHVERRCGWYENPTPGNVTLTDRDGTWVISMQGGHEAEGPSPRFSDAQWVQTNSGGHGYGCACLTLHTDTVRHVVLSVSKAAARPLDVCRRDKRLHEPPHDADADR